MRRHRDGETGGCRCERGEREPPPTDPVGERPERGTEEAEQPEREDGTARGGSEREGRPLQAEDDVREGADEREVERAAGDGRLQQRPVSQLPPDTAPAIALGCEPRQVDEG